MLNCESSIRAELLHKYIKMLSEENDALFEAVEELEKDKIRLDWLEKQNTRKVTFSRVASGHGWALYETSRKVACDSVREAIDQAMGKDSG